MQGHVVAQSGSSVCKIAPSRRVIAACQHCARTGRVHGRQTCRVWAVLGLSWLAERLAEFPGVVQHTFSRCLGWYKVAGGDVWAARLALLLLAAAGLSAHVCPMLGAVVVR